MTEDKIAEIIGLPYPTVVTLCRNRETAHTILALAINQGKLIGFKDGFESAHTLLRHAEKVPA